MSTINWVPCATERSRSKSLGNLTTLEICFIQIIYLTATQPFLSSASALLVTRSLIIHASRCVELSLLHHHHPPKKKKANEQTKEKLNNPGNTRQSQHIAADKRHSSSVLEQNERNSSKSIYNLLLLADISLARKPEAPPTFTL